VTKADSTHKLMTFIVNHPPGGVPLSGDGKGAKRSKEERRKEKAELHKAQAPSSTGTSTSAVGTPDKGATGTGGASKPASDDDDDDDDPEDGGLQFTPAVVVGTLTPTVSNGGGTTTSGDGSQQADGSVSVLDLTATSSVAGDLGNGTEEEFSVDEETLRQAREATLSGLTDAVRQALVVDPATVSASATASPQPSKGASEEGTLHRRGVRMWCVCACVCVVRVGAAGARANATLTKVCVQIRTMPLPRT
jgi:hypothetical protein